MQWTTEPGIRLWCCSLGLASRANEACKFAPARSGPRRATALTMRPATRHSLTPAFYIPRPPRLDNIALVRTSMSSIGPLFLNITAALCQGILSVGYGHWPKARLDGAITLSVASMTCADLPGPTMASAAPNMWPDTPILRRMSYLCCRKPLKQARA